MEQNRDLREAHEKSLNEMEESKRFQGSTFDTISRRRLIEDRDTILELTDKIQELQNEINCMNDSRDFKDAESVRIGQSHVTSQTVFFPTSSCRRSSTEFYEVLLAWAVWESPIPWRWPQVALKGWLGTSQGLRADVNVSPRSLDVCLVFSPFFSQLLRTWSLHEWLVLIWLRENNLCKVAERSYRICFSVPWWLSRLCKRWWRTCRRKLTRIWWRWRSSIWTRWRRSSTRIHVEVRAAWRTREALGGQWCSRERSSGTESGRPSCSRSSEFPHRRPWSGFRGQEARRARSTRSSSRRTTRARTRRWSTLGIGCTRSSSAAPRKTLSTSVTVWQTATGSRQCACWWSDTNQGRQGRSVLCWRPSSTTCPRSVPTRLLTKNGLLKSGNLMNWWK